MKLELESGTVIQDATEADIRSRLQGQAFAILSETADSYVQFARQQDGPLEYVLEYQDASLDHHFCATDASISLERVVSAFIGYLRRESGWRSEFNWERVEL